MKLTIASVLVALGLASPVGAQTASCNLETADILRLVDWSAEAEPTGTRVAMSFEGVDDKAIQMVDATMWFRDALGGRIGGIRSLGISIYAPAKKEGRTA